jgi:hypothetical protein
MRWMLFAMVAVQLSGCYVYSRGRYRAGYVYTQPAPAATVVVQPAYAQPAYAQPAYAQPAYAQPAPAQTVVVQTAQPAQPAYAQPAPAQPAYAAPAARPVCTCRQGAAEICNGCDDNCNGVVDENCARY